jgi:hypothetical protein
MAQLPSDPRRRLLLLVASLVLVASTIQGVRVYFENRALFPPDDFVEYWAAGRLNAYGQDPYDPNLLHPLQREAGRDDSEATMMWNPPWTLTLVMPFGLLPPRLSQLIWQVLSLGLVLAAADWLWLIFDGPPRLRWVAWLLALTYLPTIFVIKAGQIGPFILFGSAAFLGLMKRGYSFAAGAAAVLLAIKPHLVYLIWIVIAIQGVRLNRRMILGGVVVGLIASLIPLTTNPAVYRNYWDAMTLNTPTRWYAPTLGVLFRMLTDERRFILQFAPMILGLSWLLVWAWQSRETTWSWPNTFPALLLVSFVTTSYGAWPFDLVLLLPAIIQRASQISRANHRRLTTWAIIVYGAIDLGALTLNLLRFEALWFVWMAPTLLVLYWCLGAALKA